MATDPSQEIRASSKRKFLRYVQISLKETREARYWLRIYAHWKLGPEARVHELIGEADQISRILGAIVINTKRRMLAGHAAFAFFILNLALLLSS